MAEQSYDIAILGGGVAGVGVAYEAVSAGLKVLLLEADSCGEKTSNSSLRIIHGGFRYLQSFNLPRVLKSIKAQAEIAEQKDFVQELCCYLPLDRYGLRSRIPVSVAAQIYSYLSRISIGEAQRSRALSTQEFLSLFPELELYAEHGVLEWRDYLLKDPAKFLTSFLDAATAKGLTLKTGERVSSVEVEKGVYTVKTGYTQHRARVVVNALGPWARLIKRPYTLPTPYCGWSKSFNLLLKRALFTDAAFGFMSKQGRAFFVVPREGRSVLGTENLRFVGEPDKVSVTAEEIDRFVSDFNSSAGSLISVSDVESVEAGLLPVERFEGDTPILLGDYSIAEQNGYFELTTTKYTTFLLQAREVVKRVFSR